MTSAIDPTLGGSLDVIGAGVPRDELKTALTAAASEITNLQAGGEDTDLADLTIRVGVAEGDIDTLQLIAYPTPLALDLADGDAIIPFGVIAIISGTAAADVTYTVADGNVVGQTCQVVMAGQTDGWDITFQDDGDNEESLNTLATGVATASWFEFRWNGSAIETVASGSTVPLGAFAFLSTVAAPSVTADDSVTAETFSTTQGAIEALSASIAAGGGAPAPTVTTSNADPFALTSAMTADQNVTVKTHQDDVVFTLDKTMIAGSYVIFDAAHDGCTVAIQDAAGSITGTTTLVKGQMAVARIRSNAGSAPVVAVDGGAGTSNQSNTTASYVAADIGKTIELVASAGDQTLPLAADIPASWSMGFVNRSGGAVNIVGADATHALADDGVFAVEKLAASLIGYGSGLDAIVDLDVA